MDVPFHFSELLLVHLPNLETGIIDTWFTHLPYLPLAYLVILMWVVVANVLARIIGPMVVNHTTGRLNRVLTRKVPVKTTSDELVYHLFERSILATLNIQLLFTLYKDLAKLFCNGISTANCTEYLVPEKILIPEKYWSGCPPKGC